MIDPPQTEKRLALSDLLDSLPGDGVGTISVEQIVDHFGARAFGAVLFVFAIPNLLPLPPGSSTFLSIPLLLIAPQLALGAHKPWLPKSLGGRVLDKAMLRRLALTATPWVRKAEKLTTPRLPFLFGRPGDVLIGLVCTLLACVLVLPIPLGNLLPAASVAALSLSMIQRDGLLTLVGYAIGALSVGVLVLSGQIVVAAFQRLEHWVGAL